jgi:hypothetical protein
MALDLPVDRRQARALADDCRLQVADDAPLLAGLELAQDRLKEPQARFELPKALRARSP